MKTCEFVIKVVPGSSRTAFCGMHDGIVKVKVAAPPEKGKANKALADYLAKVLAVKKNAVTIVSGQTCPIKRISVEGIDSDDVKSTFERLQTA